jgi:DNA-binding MarR family transcriptional regulator
MGKEEKKIAAEIEEIFLQLTEMLCEHVSDSSYMPADKTSFNITEHFLIEFLGKESFASMSKLSQIVHVAPTTMTSIVDRLIRRGYLKRRRAEQDRRKVLVALSEKGKQFYYHHHHESIKIYVHFLSTLPDKGKKFYQNLSEIKRNLHYLKEYLRDT